MATKKNKLKGRGNIQKTVPEMVCIVAELQKWVGGGFLSTFQLAGWSHWEGKFG